MEGTVLDTGAKAVEKKKISAFMELIFYLGNMRNNKYSICNMLISDMKKNEAGRKDRDG